MKKFVRPLVHAVTNIRNYQYKQVGKFAAGVQKKKILELGSGKPVNNSYPYSTKHIFDSSNDFLQTDVVKSFGHTIVDATTMKSKNEYDIILCLNVLEHVYEFQKAVDNIHTALKKGGTAVISVPVIYPLHDEPGDYWRFTEHSLKKILEKFNKVKMRHKGKREFPICYYIEAVK